VSHPEWVAKEEYRLLSQRLTDLQEERIERWTKEMRDMTQTIKMLTVAAFAVAFFALVIAIVSLIATVYQVHG